MNTKTSKIIKITMIGFGVVSILGYLFGNYFKNNPTYVANEYYRLIGKDIFYIQGHKFRTPKKCYTASYKDELPTFACSVSPKELQSVLIRRSTATNESDLENFRRYSEMYVKEGNYVYIQYGPKQGEDTIYHLYVILGHGVFVSADSKELAREFADLISKQDFNMSSAGVDHDSPPIPPHQPSQPSSTRPTKADFSQH